MYKLNTHVENPMTGDSISRRFSFDPSTLDEKTWMAAFATIRADVDDLMAKAAAPERPDLVPVDLASLVAVSAP